MGINNYDITATAFDEGKTQDYELSILTGVDSFAYIIRDRSTNRLLAYRSYTFDAEEKQQWPAAFNRLVQSDSKLRSLRYGSTIMAWDTEKVTLVPHRLYDNDHPTEYLEQLTVVGLEDTVRTESFNELGAELVFAAPRESIETAERRLRPLRTHHYSGGLLTAWALRSRRIGHRSVSAAIRSGRMLVAAHRNGVMEFFNTFLFANSQDALYYLLLVYQQVGWTPNRVPLYLSGEVTEHGELYQQFYKYVEDLRFSAYGAPPATPPELAGLPSHLYFELLCLG